MNTSFVLLIAKIMIVFCNDNRNKLDVESKIPPEPVTESNIYYITSSDHQESRTSHKNISAITFSDASPKNHRRKNAVQIATLQGLNAMIDLYERKEPEIFRKGEYLEIQHPASKLSLFSAPMTNESDSEVKGAYAKLFAAQRLQESLNFDFTGLGRQASKKISLKKTSLEGFCPPREQPQCLPASKRYRTANGSCNNLRKARWGQAQLPFHRFLSPVYSDGLEKLRTSVTGESLPSARFVSLVVHGYREEEAPITMLLPQFGQLLDHDLTSTLGQRTINGSVPSCCRTDSQEPHPACLPIKVPRDDPFLSNLGVGCLEFLRSAPAQRRDCFLSWREQTNQVTSFIDASPVYSSNSQTADSLRTHRDGLLLFGRGPAREDPCLRGGFGSCIRAGDTRAAEQPGLLAMHTVFAAEHNRIALELADLNPHWSDEKLYQEARRIIGAIFQHITYREFLPLVLGKEVCRLFDLELEPSGYYRNYDAKINPTVTNVFSAAAFRFGHALIRGSIMRSDINYRFLTNNVSLHEENSSGDIGGSGSLHRIIRGMATQRTLKRDEFISPELTNHLFQSGSFPFGMDLAAINIQRGRDHGLPAYINWREPCGLSEIKSWKDLEIVAGPKSVERIRRAYGNIEDIDLFVGGISERPVVGGLVGPTFACIIAQQFSNLRKGDRFWYENPDFESSFTSAQLFSIKQVTLSQILCRSLGNSNFIQPHAFLPPEFAGNERLRCGSDILAPINLLAWTERDPFHKEVDLNNDIFMTVGTANFDKPSATSKRPFDLEHKTHKNSLLITPRPTKTTVDNKLDLDTSTITKPTRKRTTTATRKPTGIIDNKLDFAEEAVTKRPNSPFSKLGKSPQKVELSTLKSSTKKRQKDLDLTIDLADNSTTIDHYSRPDKPQEYDSGKLAKRYGASYDNDFGYDDRPYQPNYDYEKRPGPHYPSYPPLFQSMIVQRPTDYKDKRPNYDNTNNNHMRPVNTPISSIYSTPFSYDMYNVASGSLNSPQISYDNTKYILSNRVTRRPPNQKRHRRWTYLTTRKMTSLDNDISYSTHSSHFVSPSFSVSYLDLRDTDDISKLSSSISPSLFHKLYTHNKISNDDHMTSMTNEDKFLQDSKINRRSKNIQLVPFKLLTRVDRPDNWVNVNFDLKDFKSLIPDQPQLRQDPKIIALELPKPILNRRYS